MAAFVTSWLRGSHWEDERHRAHRGTEGTEKKMQVKCFGHPCGRSSFFDLSLLSLSVPSVPLCALCKAFEPHGAVGAVSPSIQGRGGGRGAARRGTLFAGGCGG